MDIRLGIVSLPEFRAESFEFKETMRVRRGAVFMREIVRQACEELPLFRVC